MVSPDSVSGEDYEYDIVPHAVLDADLVVRKVHETLTLPAFFLFWHCLATMLFLQTTLLGIICWLAPLLVLRYVLSAMVLNRLFTLLTNEQRLIDSSAGALGHVSCRPA
jgi:hypothetical protein